MKHSLIFLVAFLLLTTSAVYAEMVPSGPYTGDPAGTSSGEVLWSQLDDPAGTFTDQAFEAGYAAYDAWAADDFIVDSVWVGVGWFLDELFIPGSVSVAGANPFFMNNAFYEDAGGIPGATLAGCDFAGNTDFTSAGDGDIHINVEGCHLPPGTYWYSTQVRLDFNPFGQHWTRTELTAIGAEGVWKNPGNAFGNDCPDWAPMNTVCGGAGQSYSFELSGEIDITEPEPGVPTIGPFGVVVLILALGGGSAYVLRRRRTS